MRGWEYIFHANGKKAGVAILISDKIDLKIKMITRDKEGHYIMIQGSKPGLLHFRQILYLLSYKGT